MINDKLSLLMPINFILHNLGCGKHRIHFTVPLPNCAFQTCEMLITNLLKRELVRETAVLSYL